VILRVNRAFTRITGYTPEEAIGKKPRLFSSERQDANFYAAMWKSINSTGGWEGEVWNRRRNGGNLPGVSQQVSDRLPPRPKTFLKKGSGLPKLFINPPKEADSINNYQLTINNLQLKVNNLAYIIYTPVPPVLPKVF